MGDLGSIIAILVGGLVIMLYAGAVLAWRRERARHPRDWRDEAGPTGPGSGFPPETWGDGGDGGSSGVGGR